MKTELKALLESQVLNEETKAVISEAWTLAVNANKDELKTEYETKLQEAVSTLTQDSIRLVEEAVAEEMQSVAEELSEARALEVTYAEKLEDFKVQYAETMNEQMEAMVAETVQKEIDELKEDIEFAKKHQFGVNVFEAFRGAFASQFGEEEKNLQEAYDALVQENESFKREKIMNGILENVTGEKRKIVETLLESVATDRLEARFDALRPLVLAESKEETKEDALNEGKKPEGKVVIEQLNENEIETKDKQVNDAAQALIARALKRAR